MSRQLRQGSEGAPPILGSLGARGPCRGRSGPQRCSRPALADAQQQTFHLDRLEVPGAPDDGVVLFRPVTKDESIFYAQLGLGLSINPLRTDNITNYQPALARVADERHHDASSRRTCPPASSSSTGSPSASRCRSRGSRSGNQPTYPIAAFGERREHDVLDRRSRRGRHAARRAVRRVAEPGRRQGRRSAAQRARSHRATARRATSGATARSPRSPW